MTDEDTTGHSSRFLSLAHELASPLYDLAVWRFVDHASYLEGFIKALGLTDITLGKHYIQEDHPAAIGDAIAEWLCRVHSPAPGGEQRERRQPPNCRLGSNR